MDRDVLTVNQDEAYLAMLEYASGWMFMHCEVHKNVPSTFKRIKKQIRETKEELALRGYFLPLLSVTRNGHFARLIGGKRIGEITVENETLEVWSWE